MKLKAGKKVKCSGAITKKVSYRSRCTPSSLAAPIVTFFHRPLSARSPGFFPFNRNIVRQSSLLAGPVFTKSFNGFPEARDLPVPKTFIRRCSRSVSGNQNCQSFTELRTETFLFKFPSPRSFDSSPRTIPLPPRILAPRALATRPLSSRQPTGRQLNLHAFSGSSVAFDPFRSQLEYGSRGSWGHVCRYFVIFLPGDPIGPELFVVTEIRTDPGNLEPSYLRPLMLVERHTYQRSVWNVN